MRTQNYQSWCTFVVSCCNQCLLKSVAIISDLSRFNDVPSVCPKARWRIVTAGQISTAINGDFVVIENTYQMIKFEMTSKRSSFVTDSFHKAPITSNNVRMVIYSVLSVRRTQMRLSNRHTDRVCKTLSKRSCCHFHTRCMTNFWMTWCCRVPLTEQFQITDF